MRTSQWLATLAMIGLLFGFGSFGANGDEIIPGGDQSPQQNLTTQYHYDNMH
jgi:uncharacterized cupin superfamily protein